MPLLRNVRWTRGVPSATSPVGPPTVYAKKRCYAARLKDCSTEISREHYISKTLLEAMGGTVDVAGLSFLETKTIKGIGMGALTSKILCSRHNAALSPLDAEVRRLFDVLRMFDVAVRDNKAPNHDEVVVNGADIERWLLKVLVGLVHASVLSTDAIRPYTPWLQILFSEQDWPKGWGLAVVTSTQEQHAFGGLQITTHVVGTEVWGVSANIAGFTFRIALENNDPHQHVHPRPAGMILRAARGSRERTVTFSWPNPPESDYIEFTQIAQYVGDPPHVADLKRAK